MVYTVPEISMNVLYEFQFLNLSNHRSLMGKHWLIPCRSKQKRFSDTGNQSDNLSKVQGELDELKGIMVKNIG